VWLRDTDILRERPYRRAWLGLGRTFQTARLFQNETVFNIVRTACHHRMHGGAVRSLVAGIIGTRRSIAVEAEAADRATRLIDQLGLGDYATKMASELSYGTLRLTELATILAMEPELVLLDEPSSGIAQRETEALGPMLIDVRRQLGCSMIVIEHDMSLITALADRLMAMVAGRVVAVGSAADVLGHPVVLEAYLGKDAVQATP
jgi:branched-chain amino acid transport system ATP-binding protein